MSPRQKLKMNTPLSNVIQKPRVVSEDNKIMLVIMFHSLVL